MEMATTVEKWHDFGMDPKIEDTEVKTRRPGQTMQEWLEAEIWPHIPDEELGQPPLTKAEVEEILGFGPEGY
jgi:hypothetical protein